MKTQCDVIVVGGGASGLPNGKVDAAVGEICSRIARRIIEKKH